MKIFKQEKERRYLLSSASDNKIICTDYTDGTYKKIFEILNFGPVYSFKIEKNFLYVSANKNEGRKYFIKDIQSPPKKVGETKVRYYCSFDQSFAVFPEASLYIGMKEDFHMQVIGENMKNNRVKFFKHHEKEVLMCQSSPKAKWVITGGRDARLKMTNVASMKCYRNDFLDDVNNIYCCKMDLNRGFILIGNEKSRMIVYDYVKREIFRKIDFAKNVFTITRVGDNFYFSGWVESQVKVYNIEKNECQTLNLTF